MIVRLQRHGEHSQSWQTLFYLMLAYYYPQGKQQCIDGLTESDSYKIWEVVGEGSEE